MALNALQLRQCAAAVASGVNLILHHETSAIAQKAGMLAPDGRCKALNVAADGYGRAEVCGTLLLQPAIGDNDTPSPTVVVGSAVNQDGRSSSLTAPNGPSQQEAMRQALSSAALAAVSITALSMHGTGTALGDPIEVGAAAAVLTTGGNRPAPLALMASKSWIGHSEPGAGVVGLTHANVALTRAVMLPILHLGAVNQYVAALMGRQPGSWTVPRQPAALVALPADAGPLGARRVLGTSAFAFQGTNAHVLMTGTPLTSSAGSRPTIGRSAVWQRHRFWVSPVPHR